MPRYTFSCCGEEFEHICSIHDYPGNTPLVLHVLRICDRCQRPSTSIRLADGVNPPYILTCPLCWAATATLRGVALHPANHLRSPERFDPYRCRRCGWAGQWQGQGKLYLECPNCCDEEAERLHFRPLDLQMVVRAPGIVTRACHFQPHTSLGQLVSTQRQEDALAADLGVSCRGAQRSRALAKRRKPYNEQAAFKVIEKEKYDASAEDVEAIKSSFGEIRESLKKGK